MRFIECFWRLRRQKHSVHHYFEFNYFARIPVSGCYGRLIMGFFIGRNRTGGFDRRYPFNRNAILTIVLSACLAACGAQPAGRSTSTAVSTTAASQAIPVTGANPACKSPANPTLAVTEGPFFKAGSPEKTSFFETGMPGTKLVLSGYVLTTDCQPVGQAELDFWQANANGEYDNHGYTLRGHQFTDANGYYQLTTIVPGLYTGRTEHIHVKVQAPGGSILTTQLFFPGVDQNQSDGIFNSSLLMVVQNNSKGEKATFNFILNP